MKSRIEHANLVVRDIDAMIRFLKTAFPDFEIRFDGDDDGRWVHIGTQSTYFALTEATDEPAERWVPYEGKPGVNHIGCEVEDAAALRTRMIEAGFAESTVPNAHPHRSRVYFRDPDDNDWEFVEYHSADPAERNDYEL